MRTLLLLLLLTACTPAIVPDQPVCDKDALPCPDGSTVSRQGFDCQFPRCASCDAPAREYKAQSPQECMYVKFACPANQTMFSDSCGCGCTSDNRTTR